MAENIVLTPLASLQNDNTAIAVINANNQLIETAFADCLSRAGTAPNQMQSNLDMNSNQILNLPAPATVNSPARLIDVVSNPTIQVPPVGTSGSTVPLLNGINTWSGTQTFDGASVFTGSITSTFNISPTSSSLIPGISIVQTVSGSSGFPVGDALNLIDIQSDNAILTGTNFLNGLAISMVSGGSLMQGGRQALAAFFDLSAVSSSSNVNRNYVAILGNAYTASGDGGTNTSSGAQGAIFGLSGWGDLQSGATNMLAVTGLELNYSIRTGASAKHKTGLQIVEHALDAVAGATTDTAVAISGQTGAIGTSDGILFTAFAGQHAVTSSGTLIASTGGTFATGLDFSASTLTYFIKGPNSFYVDGSANIVGATLTTAGGIHCAGVGGIGYSTGAGGTVTQATSKSTGVTLNKITGQITMNNASLASAFADTVSFTLTNSTIAATDTVIASYAGGGTAGAYLVYVTTIAAGSCQISVLNTSGGSLSEAIVINFNVIKGASS